MGREDTNLQYLIDTEGNKTAVVVPIALWHKWLEEDDETAYLNRSPAMMARIMESLESKETHTLEEAKSLLGL